MSDSTFHIHSVQVINLRGQNTYRDASFFSVRYLMLGTYTQIEIITHDKPAVVVKVAVITKKISCSNVLVLPKYSAFKYFPSEELQK